MRFDFSTIRLATNNFSEENKIGRSMVGLVYRGRLHDGQKISVKRFYQHDSYRDYFKNEVKLATKLQHRNLVKLLGFCLQGSERRSNIIRGITRGLLYLHEDSGLTIIHRDIRARKILLDEELNPKILGFGRAKLFGADQTEEASNFPQMWTSLKGYLAPEFFQLGGLINSVKIDVFSFGVLLLEIVTGQKYTPLYHDKTLEPALISTVWRNWMEGTALNLVDPQIIDGNESEIVRCIQIGLLCIQENKFSRPTMNSVVLMLNCNCFSLPVPSRPGYFQESTRNELNGSSSSSDILNSEVIDQSDDHFKCQFLEGSTSEPHSNEYGP
ncbi:cysteine-rich receptor-like protein kinase 41 [Morus notabilis]|nr:cysteine-rich receptor-like protein kinase 41 [Morus notabilis]